MPGIYQEPVAHTRDAAFFTDDDRLGRAARRARSHSPRGRPPSLAGSGERDRRAPPGTPPGSGRGLRTPSADDRPVGGSLLAAVVAIVLVVVLRGGDAPREAAPRRHPPRNRRAAPSTRRLLSRRCSGGIALRPGDLQQALAALGHYSGVVDGVFGDSTGAAVLAFQTEHGLVADGAGPLTLLALVETLGASAETDAATAEQTIAYAEAEGRLSPQSAARYRKMPADSLAGPRSFAPAGSPPWPSCSTASRQSRSTTSPVPSRSSRCSPTTRLTWRKRALPGEAGHPQRGRSRLPLLPRTRLPVSSDCGIRPPEQARGEKENRRSPAARAGFVARGIPAAERSSGSTTSHSAGRCTRSPPASRRRWPPRRSRGARRCSRTQTRGEGRAAYLGIAKDLQLVLAGDCGPGVRLHRHGHSQRAAAVARVALRLRQHHRRRGRAEDHRAHGAGDEDAAAAIRHRLLVATSLDGSPASLHYHTYHVSLLKQLANLTGDPRGATTGSRWNGYLQAGGC